MTASIQEWCAAAIRGLIRRREDTPSLVVDVLEEWYDGRKSFMRRFLDGESIRAQALDSEISKARSENLQGEAEAERLRQAHVWAIRESELAEAARELSEAADRFNRAITDASLEPYLASELFRAATDHELHGGYPTPVAAPKAWIIRSTEEPEDEELFWSNELGWVDITAATIFSNEEKPAFDLPIGGEWVALHLGAGG